jgi:hypothetical protein
MIDESSRDVSFTDTNRGNCPPAQPMMKLRPTAVSKVELPACNETDHV